LLSYPSVEEISLSGHGYGKVIVWLEEEKIRLYSREERKALRQFDRNWWNTFIQYCRELGLKLDEASVRDAAANRSALLDRLVSLAVQDIYKDAIEEQRLTPAADADAMRQNGHAPSGNRAGATTGLSVGKLVSPVNRMLQVLDLPLLPAQGRVTEEELLAALQCVLVRVRPVETDQTHKPKLDLPLGFECIDKDVRDAAVVLRLLHGRELRKLQTNINGMINKLQEIVADPRTDTRLGRVGR